MDPKNIDLDKVAKKLSEMSDLDFARAQAKFEDKSAFEEAGLERITLFLVHEQTALFVKPSPLTGMWLINLPGGCINIPHDAKVEFSVTDIAVGSAFRFTVKFENGASYWADLIDEKQAQELAAFLKIGISTEG